MASQGQDLDSNPEENSEVKFREKLLTIDSALGAQDVEGLKFLCIGLVSHKKLEKSKSAFDLFDHLMAGELLSEKDPFLLAELLYTIRQIHLLPHIGYSKGQVKGLLPTRRKVSLFRHLLYELSEGIDSENLNSIKFLLRDKIPPTPMNFSTLEEILAVSEALQTCLDLLAFLEQQDEIDENNLILLENILKKIVPCLTKKIHNYKREKAAQEATSPADRETESLHQGEEILSKSDVQNFQNALPEVPCHNVHSRRNGDRATNGVPTSVSTEMLGASADPLSSGASAMEEVKYRMDRKHRGHCVIINNHSFTSHADRPGTHKDAECLKQVFKWLGFTVHQVDNVTKGNMEAILQEFQNHPDHADADCFVFCILTHGIFGAVYCSDEALIPIRDIMSHFTAQQCRGLAHKPKLFFIQACQGKEVHPSVPVEADAWNPEHVPPSLQDSIPVEADFLLGLATVPGYVALRHVEEGSWYIQSLCNHLKNLVPRQEDILSILTAVNNDVSQRVDKRGTKKQMPQPAFTLRKKLVFPVPQDELEL